MEDLIEGQPFGIVNLKLEVPTVNDARQKAPSFMGFDMTSERQEALAPFLEHVSAHVHDVGLVLFSAKPVTVEA